VLEKRKIVRRPRAERTQEIRHAAREAFAAHGYAGAVMADIAQAAGVAEGTIYKLFDNKRALLDSVMADWYGTLTDALKQQLRGIDDPVQKLRYLIWYHLTTIRNEPALCRVYFHEIRAQHDYRDSAMFKLNQDYTSYTVEVLREGVAAGVFRDDVPLPIIRDTIFGGLEHYAWQFLAGTKRLDVEHTTEQFWRLIVSGISAANGAGGRVDRQLAPLIERLEAVAERMER
jgi:AcrR family transcriptional regulator